MSCYFTITSSYHSADIFDVHESCEKLFSAMCNWSNHCLHHLLPSARDAGHDLRHRGHSYQLVCYNFSSTRRCFVIRMLYDSLYVTICVSQMQINSLTYLLTYLLTRKSLRPHNNTRVFKQRKAICI